MAFLTLKWATQNSKHSLIECRESTHWNEGKYCQGLSLHTFSLGGVPPMHMGHHARRQQETLLHCFLPTPRGLRMKPEIICLWIWGKEPLFTAWVWCDVDGKWHDHWKQMPYRVSLIDAQISDSRNPGCQFAFMVVLLRSRQERILFIANAGTWVMLPEIKGSSIWPYYPKV